MRLLAALAWLNVGLHVAGLLLAAAFIRPGSPLTPLPDRLRYLAAAPPGWAAAWGVWMGCAVAMVAFTAAVATHLAPRAELARLAVTVAVTAAGFDAFCDVAFITTFPMLAASSTTTNQLFPIVERLVGATSLVVANGLYSVSTLLTTLALRGRPGLAPGAVPVGSAVFAAGMLLAAAGFTGMPEHALWATGPTIGLYCVWVLLVARSLAAGGGRP